MRLNTTSQSIHSLIGKENVAASELSTGTSSANANTFPKRRCNDFDGKTVISFPYKIIQINGMPLDP